MNTREIFIAAWKLARQGERRFGGKARDYFAQSLKWVYATIRSRKMNTYLIRAAIERKAERWLIFAQICLLLVAVTVCLTPSALAYYGLAGLLTLAGLGAALLAVSGLAIVRCSRLDASC